MQENRMKILVAEDEKDIRQLIKTQLAAEGYEVLTAEDGMEALAMFQREQPDLALLDVMMPKMDGFTLLRKIRETSEMPVIFVTARGEEMERVCGLSLGADDYLVKPFGLAELSARVSVQLRHLKRREAFENQEKEEHPLLICGDIVLDPVAGTVKKGERLLDFHAKEYLILKFLLEHKGQILTKKQIYQSIWEEDYMADENTVQVHLSHIRSQIENDPKHPEYLVTFRGIGYRLSEK